MCWHRARHRQSLPSRAPPAPQPCPMAAHRAGHRAAPRAAPRSSRAVPCRAILLHAAPQDAAAPQSWQTTAHSPPAPLTLSKADETMWWISEDTWEWLMALAAGHAQPFSFSRGLRGRCWDSITWGSRAGGSGGAPREPCGAVRLPRRAPEPRTRCHLQPRSCSSPGRAPQGGRPRLASLRLPRGPGRERKQRGGLRPGAGSSRVCLGRGVRAGERAPRQMPEESGAQGWAWTGPSPSA